MLNRVKLALRLSTNAFDSELNGLIEAALLDLQITDISDPDEEDELIILAVCTFVKMHFGEPDNYDRLKASYDEQKAQLSMSSSYTDYDEDEEE